MLLMSSDPLPLHRLREAYRAELLNVFDKAFLAHYSRKFKRKKCTKEDRIGLQGAIEDNAPAEPEIKDLSEMLFLQSGKQLYHTLKNEFHLLRILETAEIT